jgi:hypothetical protein
MRAVLVSVLATLVVACAKESNRLDAVGAASAPLLAASSARPPRIDVGAAKDACGSICERSQVLKCKNADECMVNCLAAASGTPCNAEFLAFYRCLVAQPLKNWECAEDGVAAIKPGICDGEQRRTIQCMQEKATQP